jgi:peptidylprolyl isomerase
MTAMNALWVAYKEAQGRWSGCNWPTHYGSLGLDLDGISSRQAYQAADRWRTIATDEVADDEITADEKNSLVDMALHLRLGRGVVCLGEDLPGGLLVCGSPAVRFCAEILAREWEFAAHWLEEIESDAHWAEEEAQAAVRAAADGEWEHALGHARQACVIESGYQTPRPWRPLKQAIEGAVRGSPVSYQSTGERSMRTVQPGDRVQVHYVKRFQDGSRAASREQAPLELTVGVDHPRLPGLGLALVGLAPGTRTTVRVPPERAYGLPDPARVHHWARTRFPQGQPLAVGQWVPVLTRKGRPRLVRIVEVRGRIVVVDTNHRWAGQAMVLEVELLGIQAPAAG